MFILEIVFSNLLKLTSWQKKKKKHFVETKKYVYKNDVNNFV